VVHGMLPVTLNAQLRQKLMKVSKIVGKFPRDRRLPWIPGDPAIGREPSPGRSS
jgi:hypothetical protein